MNKVDILKKYYREICTTPDYGFCFRDDISKRRLNNAIKSFAFGIDKNTIIGFYDTTVMLTGKRGYIFTDTKVYYKNMFEKSKKLWYDDIKSLDIVEKYLIEDSKKSLKFDLYDGSSVIWEDIWLNKTPLLKFFNEILELDNNYKNQKIYMTNYNEKNSKDYSIAGIGIGNYNTVNKLYEEEKFNANQGHGFSAERANNLVDKLSGHNAKIVGDNNEINGADRVVDGIEIQSKYCATGSRCIQECFDDRGEFRYYNKDGQPMKIEVPSDKYDDAIKVMEEKIRKGQIKNIKDPSEAKNIIKKGHITYEQAKNIAKAGTVDSLIYDSINGIVTSVSSIGVSASITFAVSIWNGENFDIALKNAIFIGIKTGGVTFVTSVLASQLSKAGLNSLLVSSSEAIVKAMGPKASSILVNAFRNGSNIYGAAAMKSAAKLLRSNVITAGITIVVLSAGDIIDIFRGRISGKQLFKNIASASTSVAGGTAGWMGGAAAGSVIPVVGTIVGGLAGSIVGGLVANKATNTLLSFIENDGDEMVKIIENEFKKLVEDYLLSKKEAEKVADALRDKLDGKTLKEMFSSENKGAYAKNILIPIIEKEISKRVHIILPNEDEMINSIRIFLEDISDFGCSSNNISN